MNRVTEALDIDGLWKTGEETRMVQVNYAVLYHGLTKAVGYIKPSGASRAIRFEMMKTRDEVQQILNTLS